MQVQVKVFASLAQRLMDVGAGQAMVVSLDTDSTVADVIDRMGFPKSEVKVVFVNGRARSPDWVLQEGDQVGIFPPIGGG